MRRLCRIRYVELVSSLGDSSYCRVRLGSRSLRIVLSSLSASLEPCTDSLVEEAATRHVKLINNILTLLVTVIGTILVAGAEAGFIVSLVALVLWLISWTRGKKGRMLVDTVSEAKDLDAVTSRLYEDITNLLEIAVDEARKICGKEHRCRARLPESFRTRCEQYLSRHPYLETSS